MHLSIALAMLALPIAAAVETVDFQKDVQPILAEKCFSCHGDEVQQAGLRLDRRQNAMRGGDYGPVIVAGKSGESKLIRRLVSGDGGMQMPPTGPLSKDEITILRAWIDQGADYRQDVKDEPPPPPLDPKVEAVISAARSSDVALLGRLLAADPKLATAADRSGSTPLHHAAGFGSVATMKLLLGHSAQVDARNKRRSTPLIWGIQDEAKVRMLLDRGANVNLKQAEGRTPLFLATQLGNGNAIIRLLLERGADPNISTANGQTPLMNAARRGDVEAMRLLLAKKADVNAHSGAGATPLMAAAEGSNPRAVELLLGAGADPNAVSKRNETALADAATAGVDETVKMLLDRGAKVNVRDDRGYSPLMYGAASDAVPSGIVKMLLAKGADASFEAEGETALSLALKRGYTESARLLGAKAPAAEPPSSQASPRPVSESVRGALALLEKQSHNFIRIGGCNACHAQDLPSAAAALARDRGLPAPASIPQLPPSMVNVTTERAMDFTVIGSNSVAWELFDLGMNRAPKTPYTDAIVRYIRAMQSPEGNWHVVEGRRPPMNSGPFQTVALAVYAMTHYAPEGDTAGCREAVARAARWLETARSTKTQDRVFHLLGLAWSNGSPDIRKRVAAELAAAQRADGGWNQLAAMPSDAYATGQALYALASAGGMSASDPVYSRGVRYLLQTQSADGSWHVKTRSIWFQPYFESGFPYGHDQWISAAGTAWASMALSYASEAPRADPAVSAAAAR